MGVGKAGTQYWTCRISDIYTCRAYSVNCKSVYCIDRHITNDPCCRISAAGMRDCSTLVFFRKNGYDGLVNLNPGILHVRIRREIKMDFLSYREQLGIGLCDNKKYQHFLTILFNFLNGIPTDRSFSGISTKEYLRFCSTTGTQISNTYMNEQRGDNRYNHCIRVFAENADEPKNFFSYYIAFTNVLPIKRDGYAFLERGTFANLLVQMLKDSHIAVDLVVKNGEYFVFPKGAVELDSALVSQPLTWLNQYDTYIM
mgnify:CR=1 FL=1